MEYSIVIYVGVPIIYIVSTEYPGSFYRLSPLPEIGICSGLILLNFLQAFFGYFLDADLAA